VDATSGRDLSVPLCARHEGASHKKRRKGRTRRAAAPGILLAAWAGSGAASAADWPTYGYDAARSGATTEQLPSPLVLRWSLTLAPRAGETLINGVELVRE
jgi:hypothetical protein